MEETNKIFVGDKIRTFCSSTAGVGKIAEAELDQGQPRSPRNEVRRTSSPNFPKHRWFQNVIHNV